MTRLADAVSKLRRPHAVPNETAATDGPGTERTARTLRRTDTKRARLDRSAIVSRVFVDAAIVNATYVTAFLIRFLIIVLFRSEAATTELAQSFLQQYASSVLILHAITSVVFYLAGFYTYGRTYSGRHKLAVIVLAASTAYFLFVAITFVIFDSRLGLARSVPFIAWVLATALLVSARLWSRMWRRAVTLENRVLGNWDESRRLDDILVIGGAGYIGSHLTRQLLDAGSRVHVLDAFLYGRAGLAGVEDNPRLFVTEADSRDIAAVTEAIRKVDAVVHLGEIVGDPACAVDEQLTLEINLLATRVIAEIAKGYGIRRFVYASSCSVYGATSEVVSEVSELNPVSLYARAKIASEEALTELADERFLPTILRFSTVYGWSVRPRFDLVVNLLSAKAATGTGITVFGGEQWRPFVHVQDAAKAIRLMLESAEGVVGGQIFNVGSDQENYSLRQIAGIIQKAVPGAVVEYDEAKEDNRTYRVSFDKIRSLTGFEPTWTVEAGVREMVSKIRSGEVSNHEERRYSNYRTFSDPEELAPLRSVRSAVRTGWGRGTALSSSGLQPTSASEEG